MRQPTAVPASDRERIAGTYRYPASDEWFAITAVRDELRLTGGGNTTLIPDGPDAFRTRADVRLQVQRAGGKVSGIRRSDATGLVMQFERMTAASLSSAQLAAYAGTYRSPELDAAIVLRADSGVLVLHSAPGDSARLVPLYRDGFRVGTSPFTVRFVRDAHGRVTELRAFAGRARNVQFERVAAR